MTQTLTAGQELAGVDFNPSGDERVALIKTQTAHLIDLLLQTPSKGRQAHLIDVAIDNLLAAQMWAVKALTFKEAEYV